jgi:hypothetical protein
VNVEQYAKREYLKSVANKGNGISMPYAGDPFSTKINCNGTPAFFSRGILKVPGTAVGLYVERVEFTARNGLGSY